MEFEAHLEWCWNDVELLREVIDLVESDDGDVEGLMDDEDDEEEEEERFV